MSNDIMRVASNLASSYRGPAVLHDHVPVDASHYFPNINPLPLHYTVECNVRTHAWIQQLAGYKSEDTRIDGPPYAGCLSICNLRSLTISFHWVLGIIACICLPNLHNFDRCTVPGYHKLNPRPDPAMQPPRYAKSTLFVECVPNPPNHRVIQNLPFLAFLPQR